MSTIQILNIVGLSFDIEGVLLLFKYGLPSDVTKHGGDILVSNSKESELRKYKKYKFMSKLALSLLVLGFIIQITANINCFK